MESKTEERKECMGRATAIHVLARMAYDRKLSVEEVNALQMAVRCIAKRHFEHERNKKRRAAAAAAAPGGAFAPLAEEGGTAAALPDADGAAAAPVDAAVMAERVRAVAGRMRELEKVATAEQVRMGPFALSLWLLGFIQRLEQAVGDDPNPWEPYTEPVRIAMLPKRETARQDATPPEAEAANGQTVPRPDGQTEGGAA